MADPSRSLLRIPYKHTVLFMYGMDLYSWDRPIWYRATNNATILKQADEDIQRFSNNNFTSKYAVIITSILPHDDVNIVLTATFRF